MPKRGKANRCSRNHSRAAPTAASKQAWGTTTNCTIHHVSATVARFMLNTARRPPAKDSNKRETEKMVAVISATCLANSPANNPAPPVVTRFNQRSPAEYKLRSHPTVKPTGLVADAIQDVTRRGDLVLDLFLGSGTTLMAADRAGRRFRGIDIDPGYVDVAVERWSARTGLEPRLERAEP